MDLGNIVGQLMKDGLTPATQGRLQNAMSQSGLGGLGGSGGLGDLLGNVLGGGTSGGGAPSGGLGGILGSTGNVLSADSGVGGMSRGQVGGLGALAGALLGGGGSSVKGAVGGSAMALLGTLAVSALQNWQQQQAQSGSSGDALARSLSEPEIQQMIAPQTAELCLRGMIEAVKSDGNIARDEVERIVGKLEEGGITPEERQFVTEHMQGPPDVAGLIAAIPNREVGAQVYTAALMAISVDTGEERTFLAKLAQGTGLDGATVNRLHAMVGAPPLSA